MASGSFKDQVELDLLNIITGQAATVRTLTLPLTALYVSLYTTAPNDVDASGTEATGGGYVRVNSIGLWGTAAAGQVANNAAVNFAAFSGSVSSGATFKAWGLHTAVSGTANQIGWGPLIDQTRTGTTGDVMQFAISALVVTLD